ncbi:hypothetical protein Clacol_008358 [Clathrus columnatus]|uniref:Meiotically up-regulated protein Msb1/Mug8 domain-containing protein n=1 Tax=Clathrus columnatus TaxID=1419009 RepID=A0AAV5AHH6_9AGAM|nr:hypothetical protein Clacol_008358 [Clathrus columnatus]
MPSIFTRSRTTSTPKPRTPTVADEFGRVTSRTSISTTSKKDKKKDKLQPPTDSIEIQLTEGGFLPFYVPQDSEERVKLPRYGYLSYKCELVLGIDEVFRLVDVISREFNERGLTTTPLLFSAQALDISPIRIHRLINAFLATCPSETYSPGSPTDKAWLDEARFSGPHELAMLLRWGLARIVRLINGQESRGFLNWEIYLRWREEEAATHATSSGLTPPTLASLFGPLMFGLGSPGLPFHHTYGAYLRSSHAAEHLLLAYVRAQAPPLPSRLADWIRGYPAMLPTPNRLDKARPGAKIKKLNTVKRYVRLFSNDLVKTGAAWDLGNSKEWSRVIGPAGMKIGGPKYGDAYRKQMGLTVNDYPETGLTSSADTSPTSNTEESDAVDPLAPKEDQLRFRSLTDLKWGEFESMGFSNSSSVTEKRLEFDLNEGARNTLPAKRTTLTWTDFSQTGFMRNDAPLSATLQFSAPLSHTISTWPSKQHEIHAKLKKTQKALPAFSWDTTPILGGEEAVEENFLEIWCDVLYGGGWVRREERVWRDCSWALVDYKAMPLNRPSGPTPADPRTSTSLWLYEEFIPNDYKSELSQPKRKLLLPSLTLPFSSKQSYNAGNVHPVTAGPSGQGYSAKLPSARELEFEGLLQREAGTKIISLGHNLSVAGGGGARESAISATLSLSELGHVNVSEIGHGQALGEYSTQYVDGNREVSGDPYIPTMQETSSAHVSSSIAPGQGEIPMAAGADAHSTNIPRLQISPPIPSPRSDSKAASHTTPSNTATTPTVPSNTTTQGGFFTAMTTPRKSPARFLSRVGKSKNNISGSNGGGGSGSNVGGGGGGGSGEGSGSTLGDENGQGVEKAKRVGKDRSKARSSILRGKGKGSEYDASIEFETRTIFGGEEGDVREVNEEEVEDNGGKTPTQHKFPRAYNHARNLSKDDAWVDILVSSTTSGSPNAVAPRRRSSDPESMGVFSTSSHPLHDPDKVREEIRQALKGAGPRPAEFSDNEIGDTSPIADRTFLSEDQPLMNVIDDGDDEDVETEASTDIQEDDEDLYGAPEPPLNVIQDSDFRNGAANAERGSSDAPHGQGNGHSLMQLPSSSAGSSGKDIRSIYYQKDTDHDSSPSPHTIPKHDFKIPASLPIVPSNSSASSGLAPISTSYFPNVLQPSTSLKDQNDEIPDIDDTESQFAQHDDELIDPSDLLIGLPVNPATPRYVHGAPLHNVVEEEEE